MPKAIEKREVKVDIKIGEVSPAQRASWRKFWLKLLAEAKKT